MNWDLASAGGHSALLDSCGNGSSRPRELAGTSDLQQACPTSVETKREGLNQKKEKCNETHYSLSLFGID